MEMLQADKDKVSKIEEEIEITTKAEEEDVLKL